MRDEILLKYLFGEFCKPFKSTLFYIVFFIVFIPIGSFGIHYQYYGSNYTAGFWDLFTPESIFTYLVPLIVSIVIDGVISIVNKFKSMDKDSFEFDLLRDCSILGVVVLILCIFFIYLALENNSVLFIIPSVLLTWILWILLSAGKDEFKPRNNWTPNGSKNDTSAEEITNG